MAGHWEVFSKNKALMIPLVIALILVLGFIDFKTGYELSFFLFYIFPIVIAAWYLGRPYAMAASVMSFVMWLLAFKATGHEYSQEWILYWNSFMRLSFFLIFGVLLSTLKRKYDHEASWARTDPLTKAMNGRGFRERLNILFPIAARSKTPFAMAFVDLDNFKKINDTKGHAEGDLILQSVVKEMKEHLRTTDLIGRMGGDEFAIFLPSTDAAGAENVLRNLHSELSAMVKDKGWKIGFSMGAVTFDPKTYDVPSYQDVIQQADKLMYTIKHNGKNNLVVEEWGGVSNVIASVARQSSV